MGTRWGLVAGCVGLPVRMQGKFAVLCWRINGMCSCGIQLLVVVAGLAHLDLRLNHLEQLPTSLSRCTKLTALLLGMNDDLTPGGLDDGTASLLAALPALARLQLPHSAASGPRGVEGAHSLLADCGGSHIGEATFAKIPGLGADDTEWDITATCASSVTLLHSSWHLCHCDATA